MPFHLPQIVYCVEPLPPISRGYTNGSVFYHIVFDIRLYRVNKTTPKNLWSLPEMKFPYLVAVYLYVLEPFPNPVFSSILRSFFFLYCVRKIIAIRRDIFSPLHKIHLHIDPSTPHHISRYSNITVVSYHCTISVDIHPVHRKATVFPKYIPPPH